MLKIFAQLNNFIYIDLSDAVHQHLRVKACRTDIARSVLVYRPAVSRPVHDRRICQLNPHVRRRDGICYRLRRVSVEPFCRRIIDDRRNCLNRISRLCKGMDYSLVHTGIICNDQILARLAEHNVSDQFHRRAGKLHPPVFISHLNSNIPFHVTVSFYSLNTYFS